MTEVVELTVLDVLVTVEVAVLVTVTLVDVVSDTLEDVVVVLMVEVASSKGKQEKKMKR